MVKARPAISLLGPALAACLVAPVARAEWRFTPTVDLRETWTDNVNLAPPGQEHSRLVSTLSPGFELVDETPRLQFRANYRLSLYDYRGSRPDNTQRHTSYLSADLKARLLGEVLFLDANASVQQTPISAFGPQLPGGGYASSNSSETRSYRISPYLRESFGNLASGELRYVHDYVSSGVAGFGQSTSDSLSLLLASGPTFRKVGWTMTAQRQVLHDNIANDSTIDAANLALRYLLSTQLTLNLSGGYDRFDYHSQGGKTQGASYAGGFRWDPSGRTTVEANIGHRFYGPSYYLSAQHHSRGTVWNISYDDAVTNSRNQFTLPATVNTAAFLSQLFSVSIPDPLQRAAFVQAYIAARGLPTALPNAINYLSNRYTLQRQFRASSAMQLAHSTAMFTVFRTKRQALSETQQDSALLGSQFLNLNDNTDQKGLNATLSYQLGPRSQATLSAAAYKTESLSTGRVDNSRQLSLFLSRQFSAKLSGIAEVRRTRGSSFGLVGGKYTENALSAGLSMKF